MESIQEFFPSSENIKTLKKLLKSQGVDVCQSKIEKEWISESVGKFSYGYAYITPKAQVGRRSLKSAEDRFVLHGYVLCRIDKNNPRVVWLDLICSRERSKTGTVLLELAEEHARTMKDIVSFRLLSLPERSLKKWYEKMGFAVMDLHFFEKNPKAYMMEKIFCK